MLLALALLACLSESTPVKGSDDPATSTDDAATRDPADTGGADATRDGSTTDESGFEFDGAWYPVEDGHVGCYTFSDEYVVVGDGNRDGATDSAESTMGMATVYFASRPTTGTYTLAYFDGYVSITGATDAAVTVYDDTRTLFAYSDGVAGTVTVVEDDAGGLTIGWSGVSQYGAYAAGGTYSSDSGELTCPAGS